MISESIPFIPGLKLCESFYHEAVRQILDRHFPALTHSAARLDAGSDVLGFDTPLSRDHGWGPKVTLFLEPGDMERKDQISDLLAVQLPTEIHAYPTNFDTPFSGEGKMVPVESGAINHWVEMCSIKEFFQEYLGFDPQGTIGIMDWLTSPQQHLRTVASGKVFHDGMHRLTRIQENCPGTQRISGATYWRTNGAVSTRKNRSWHAAAMWVMKSVHTLSRSGRWLKS